MVQVESEPDPATVRSPEEQKAALERALQAAKSGDAFGMLTALHAGQVHDGLYRQLKAKWPGLLASDVDTAIGAAEDALFERVRAGAVVRSVAGFLWRAGDRACQKLSERRPATGLESTPDAQSDLTGRAYGLLHRETNDQDEIGRRSVLAEIRSLVPRIGTGQVQAVAHLLLDAVEADQYDFGPDDVVEALGIDRPSAKTLLWRAKQRLWRELEASKGIEVPQPFRSQIDMGEEVSDDEHA